MTMTVSLLLLGICFVFILAAALGKIALWPAVLCLLLERLLTVLPLK